ncbi:RNA-directed DNA polymerase, eukaryota [Tanacetum coccineum]|uniref:RNA-directed DNA polymerase, eukaryota n=1 Tax=Tanacetum coccineum TaxID=301880 RepID=A0ABQ4YJG8_9ASTR
MQVYWASILVIPMGIVYDIQQVIRGFLWCNGEYKHGKAKVAWVDICLPKKEGGLGLCSLEIFNLALMTTHIWNIVSNKESLWVRWINTYKLRGRTLWDVQPSENMSYGWRKLLQLREHVKPFFWSCIDNGMNTSLWYDIWSSHCLLSRFLTPRDIARCRRYYIQSCLPDLLVNGAWNWPLSWLAKAPNLGLIPAPNIVLVRQDYMKWCATNGTMTDFSVKCAWEVLRPRGIEKLEDARQVKAMGCCSYNRYNSGVDSNSWAGGHGCGAAYFGQHPCVVPTNGKQENYTEYCCASVDNLSGILCVWDPKSFQKTNVTVSDYFVMIRGVWVPNGKKLLIISVYAPQELNEKKMLWDYISHVMSNWKGDVVIMGDFNEVRKKAERFGSVFNVQGADAFNLFISNASLEEVPLGGCSFTWCHKSATKMSKLDRFLISESLMSACPNISAITLDRYLSDHRPILMRESHYDYGPVPFRFFHYWFEMEGFDKFVEESWKEAPVAETNALIKMMKKLKYLKEKIFNKRTNVVRSLQELEKFQSLETAQKAKIKWAIEGDENSKYYHGILNKKRSQLAIRGILVDGNWIDSPGLVKSEFLSHFKNRFDQPQETRLHLDMNFPNNLNSDQQADLECEVTKEEIKRAVWDCGIDKSPGPDGFTFGFYRRYWKILESDVVDAVTCFFQQGNFPKGGNSSFITLIPKTPDANMVKDFRPISLIGSMYKIIAKILANRLVVVLGNLVNEVQSAFVADRQILDGPFILNELLQWCKSKKKHSLVFKVDFEKAYDSVRGSVIVNGSPTEEFQFYKGLKQGDPLSLFLFILVMESLHVSFQRVVDAGMFKGITLGSSLHLSHMFYADDAIFMGQWSESNISTIVHVLDCFHRVSGLRINMSKSKLMGIFVDADKVDQAARKIGCVTLKTPFIYLGSKVGGLMSRVQSWNETVEGMVARLSKWKMKTLSIGGVTTYGIHPISFFQWSRACCSSLWARVIKAIHGEDGKISKKVKSSYPSIWLDIVHEVDMFKYRGIDLISYIHKKLGNEANTLFWEDAWRGDIAFKCLYPRVYALELCKSIDVASKMAQCNLGHSFRRDPRGEFSVASVRRLIDDYMLPEVTSKTRWMKAVPIKVNVLAWKEKLDCLPTRLNISRRGMDIEVFFYVSMCG